MSSKTPVSQLIVKDIQKQIFDGVYVSGDKLPNERDLAAHYGVSRIPVREALKILSQIGLIESRHGSGTYVHDLHPDKISEQLVHFLKSKKFCEEEMMQLCRLIEVEAASMAAQNRTDEELTSIKELEATCEKELVKGSNCNIPVFLQYDFEFHTAIGKASHSNVLDDFIQILHSGFLNKHYHLEVDEHIAHTIMVHHRNLCDFIENKNPNGAASHMRDKLIFCFNKLLEQERG